MVKHFSQEYLERLQHEHKLVNAALINLKNNPRKYTQMTFMKPFDEAVLKLESEKIQLESKIDVLTSFLND